MAQLCKKAYYEVFSSNSSLDRFIIEQGGNYEITVKNMGDAVFNETFSFLFEKNV